MKKPNLKINIAGHITTVMDNDTGECMVNKIGDTFAMFTVPSDRCVNLLSYSVVPDLNLGTGLEASELPEPATTPANGKKLYFAGFALDFYSDIEKKGRPAKVIHLNEPMVIQDDTSVSGLLTFNEGFEVKLSIARGVVDEKDPLGITAMLSGGQVHLSLAVNIRVSAVKETATVFISDTNITEVIGLDEEPSGGVSENQDIVDDLYVKYVVLNWK